MIDIIGIGSGGVESLSKGALGRIEAAKILVGTKRHLELFPGFKGTLIELGPLKAALKKIKAAGSTPVVVLATGDPGLFGIGEYLTRELGSRRVRITPNVSIVQEAFSKIKVSQVGVKVVSVHGGKAGEDRGVEKAADAIMSNLKTAVYTDPKNTPSKIAKALIRKGANGYKVIVFETLGTKEEKITRGTLSFIARKRFNPLNLMVVFNKMGEEVQESPLFGRDASEYNHTNGLITKAEVRAVTLSKLALSPGLTLWDVGSGSGSVAIEAAGLIGTGKVYAIEQKAERIKNIKANRARFKSTNVEIICAKAPAGLAKLPAPDRVFVGGGGKGVVDILKLVAKRLRPGGLIVVNAVTIETLTNASEFFKKNGWSFEVVSINIARSRDIAGVKIMDAENPVSVITARKL
jgi:precorrin-6Y C5,15-methyltransferase (decarboxylating)